MFFYPWFQLRWDLPAFGTYSDTFTYYTSTECSQNMNLGNGTFVEVNIPLGWWVWSWNFTSKIPLFKCSESTICYVRLVVAETIFLLKVCLDHTEMKNFFSKVFYWKHTKFVYVYRIIYLKKKIPDTSLGKHVAYICVWWERKELKGHERYEKSPEFLSHQAILPHP